MPYLELEVPPGLYRNGTQFQSRGRWYDGSLVRWYGGAMQPVGGWQEIQFTGNDIVPEATGSEGFGDYATGSLPSGWTEYQSRGTESPGTGFADQDWTVETDGDSPSGQSLQMADRADIYNGVVLWSDVTDFADGEVLALVTIPENLGTIGVTARNSAGFPMTCITARLANFGGSFFVEAHRASGVAKGSNIDSTQIGTSVALSGAAVGEEWWIRFNFNGSSIKVRAWEDGSAEPGTWQIDETAASATTAAGAIGIFATCPNSTTPQSASVVAFTSTAGGTAVDDGTGGSTVNSITSIDEAIHGALAWRDNSNVPWLALGTPTKCWIYSEGLVSDVTPGGFVTGNADGSTQIAGYGTGAYGAGLYGTGVADSVGTILEAQSWQFDTFGELLIAVAHSDGKLYSWTPNVDTELQTIANAPTDNKGVVVTPERFLVALGADGDPRNIVWADQESLTTWTATPENQAGDFILPGSGTIMCGQRARQETLIWTTSDLFTMQYIGGTLVYSFSQVGTNCGIIGRRAYAMVDGARAMWMGTDSFFAYEGGVIPLPCEVGDDVFNDINTDQASKIFAVVFSEFSEIWWFYPSAASDDIDKYVAFNYAEGHWSMGDLARTAGVPRGAFAYPILTDRNGKLYDHERGTTYYDLDGETALVPFVESGPIDIAQGDRTMWVRYIIPDENTLGDTRAYLKSRLYPTATEQTFGPFSMAEPTSTRMSGRQVTLRIEQVNPGWRIGVPRLEVVPAGMR